VVDKVLALIALIRALNLAIQKDEPDEDSVADGGSVHIAFLVVADTYKGKLPVHVKDTWRELTDPRIGNHFQTFANFILSWAAKEVATSIQNVDSPGLDQLISKMNVPLLIDEKQYRAVARQLIPDFEGPQDNSRVAALLCKEIGLQPSEFSKLSARDKRGFLMAISSDRESASKAATDKARPIRDKWLDARDH